MIKTNRPAGSLAPCIMVLGTSSGAGKSLLTTALCRYYARLGYKVAPFKAQNMSNNARVVLGQNHKEGEIGSAQYFQALAAKAEPHVSMNPLLLKPEKDTQSQVVLMGEVNKELSLMPWRGRSQHVWPVITKALDHLRAHHDLVIIEGAGSPAEINLHDSDIVNMRVALHCDANCLLVTDIDRGGAFAHLYGTWALLPENEQALFKGFVLNMFRGDASLLAPAPEMLQEKTGIPTVATLPMWREHGLPEEDGVFDDRSRSRGAVQQTIAVIAWPRISNLDEFQPLKNIPGVLLRWARSPAEVAEADIIILPGSKHTSSDLTWMRHQGLDIAVSNHAARGKTVLGICGGLQMLGEALIDPHGIDGNAPGLGLLPLVTLFEEEKIVKRSHATFTDFTGSFNALANLAVNGYEIHHGQTTQHLGMATAGSVAQVILKNQEGKPLGWTNERGNVLGLYLHGLFEDPNALKAMFGNDVPTLESSFEGLADYVEKHFTPGFLKRLVKTQTD